MKPLKPLGTRGAFGERFKIEREAYAVSIAEVVSDRLAPALLDAAAVEAIEAGERPPPALRIDGADAMNLVRAMVHAALVRACTPDSHGYVVYYPSGQIDCNAALVMPRELGYLQMFADAEQVAWYGWAPPP